MGDRRYGQLHQDSLFQDAEYPEQVQDRHLRVQGDHGRHLDVVRRGRPGPALGTGRVQGRAGKGHDLAGRQAKHVLPAHRRDVRELRRPLPLPDAARAAPDPRIQQGRGLPAPHHAEVPRQGQRRGADAQVPLHGAHVRPRAARRLAQPRHLPARERPPLGAHPRLHPHHRLLRGAGQHLLLNLHADRRDAHVHDQPAARALQAARREPLVRALVLPHLPRSHLRHPQRARARAGQAGVGEQGLQEADEPRRRRRTLPSLQALLGRPLLKVLRGCRQGPLELVGVGVAKQLVYRGAFINKEELRPGAAARWRAIFSVDLFR
mmetsp:Transcript_19923/g.37157  ORF Transcript_19923/g.37157 Transcript_19923/m.37157 type:complete len:321 (+) Transcript_19923:562-1524(+)